MLPPLLPDKEYEADFHFSFEIEKLDTLNSKTRTQNIRLVPDSKDVKLVSMNLASKQLNDDLILNPHNIVKFILIDDENFTIPPG